MNHPKIIGIAAKARSGKDTVADVLVREFGYMKQGFADPIKAFLCGVLDWTPVKLEGRKGDEEVRVALQQIGTDIFRKRFDSAVWVNRFWRTAEATVRMGFRICIPDVRFENEVEAIRTWGGVVWGVRRPNHEDELKGELAMHASESEVELITPDHMFVNDGTVEALRDAVREAMGVGKVEATT